MNSNTKYLKFEPFYIYHCKSDGYGIFDITEQKSGFNIEIIDSDHHYTLKNSQTIIFNYKDTIVPFVLICKKKTFSHIFIKKYIKDKTDEPYKKLLNKSIHIITSDPQIICEYKMNASCKTNIEIRTYNLCDDISTITCEYFYGYSELNPEPPSSVFKKIDKKYIINKHSWLKQIK
jgi:hypothetical protein